MTTQMLARTIALSLALAAGSAEASFHLMKVVQVFPGTAAVPNAQYVMIQMYAAGQNQVGSHQISVFGATGNLIQAFTFSGPVSNGASQARILIATTEAATLFGMSPDLTMTAILPTAGGKVCFDSSPTDCVGWGNYSGSPAGIGTPFNAGSGLVAGVAAIRRLDIAGGAGTLEASDDTDDCANDFVASSPIPRNNDTLFLGSLE